MDSPFRFCRCPPLRSPAPRRSSCQIAGAAGAVAGQAPLADRTFADVALVAAAGAVLRVRRSTTSSAPTARRPTSRTQRQDGFFRLAALYQERYAKTPADDRRGGDAHLRPAVHRKPTGCRSSTAAWCASISAPAPSCSRPPASPSPISTAIVFYDLTGSYGVNIFGNDFYKECIARSRKARARARPGARPLPSRHRRQRRSGCARFPASTKSRSTCPAPRR